MSSKQCAQSRMNQLQKIIWANICYWGAVGLIDTSPVWQHQNQYIILGNYPTTTASPGTDPSVIFLISDYWFLLPRLMGLFRCPDWPLFITFHYKQIYRSDNFTNITHLHDLWYKLPKLLKYYGARVVRKNYLKVQVVFRLFWILVW